MPEKSPEKVPYGCYPQGTGFCNVHGYDVHLCPVNINKKRNG